MKNVLLEPGALSQAVPLRVPARSGLLTGLSAGDQVYGFRNAGARPLSIGRVDLAWVTTTVSSAALAGLAFALYKVSGFTAIQDGGTPIAIDDILLRRNLGHTALVSGTDFQCAIGGTAAITGGTGATIADGDEPFHMSVAGIGVLSGTSMTAWMQDAWQPGPDNLPITLDQHEGLIITTVAAFATALAGRLFVGLSQVKT